MRKLCLDFLTAQEVPAPRLIELAAEYGCSHVGLMVHPMRPFPFYDLLRDTKARRETRNRCADLGIKVDVTDAFNIQAETDPEVFRQAMESSAYLGAEWINIIARDPDESRLLNTFGDTCEMAKEYGLKVLSEFSRRFAHDSLDTTVRFLKKLGNPDARVTFDTMHFFRNSGTIENMKQHLDWIGRVQLCDGAGDLPPEEQLMEARTRRLPPGEGIFPLQEVVTAMPRHVVIGVEVPNNTMTYQERIKRSVSRTRAMFEQAERQQGK